MAMRYSFGCLAPYNDTAVFVRNPRLSVLIMASPRLDEVWLMNIGNILRTIERPVDGIIDVPLRIPPHPDADFNQGHCHHQQIGKKEHAPETLAHDTPFILLTL